MPQNIRILSTKKLTAPQRERLLHAGFALVEMEFITTEPVAFTAPEKIEKAIITSQNAVAVIKEHSLQIGQCFCVGEKTAEALRLAGHPPVIREASGEKLARALVEHYPGEHFYYLGTRSRRKELPEILRENKTPLTEIEVYRTIARPDSIPGNFDGILFFSPSAVQAFHEKNTAGESICFCIGPTTAGAFNYPSAEVITARKPTAEHLILETINYFNKQREHSTIQ